MTQTIIKVPAVGGGAFDPTDIVITDNTSGAWLIKDDAGTPHEYMRIDTTTGSKATTFTVDYDAAGSNVWKVGTDRTAGSGNMLVVNSRNTGLGNIEGVFMSGPSTSQVWVNGPGVFRLQGSNFTHNMTGSNNATTYLGTAADWIVTRGSPSEQMVKFEHDSNMTFTLDDSAGGVFKVQDNAGTPTEFLKIDSTTGARDVRLQTGHSNQYVLFNQTGNYSSFRNGNNNQIFLTANDQMDIYGKFCTHRQYSGGYFRSVNTGGTIQLFAVEENSNTTFRLNTATPGVFKVQDHGTTNDFLKIDSDPTAALIEFNVPSGQGAGMTVNLPADGTSGNPNTGFQCTVPGGAGYLKFGRQATGIYTGGTAFQASAGNCTFTLQGNSYMLQSSSPDIVMNLNNSSVDFRVTDQSDVNIFTIAESNAITSYSDSFTFRTTSGSSMMQVANQRMGLNGGAALKHIELYGAPSSQDASHAYGNRLLNINNTFKFSSAGTAAATISANWYVTKTNNTSAIAKQYVTLHNLNATHNAIFQFPVRSGYGTAVAMDSDATDFLNASGSFTLTPGQAAIMEITTYNALGTDAGLRHYVRTIGKG